MGLTLVAVVAASAGALVAWLATKRSPGRGSHGQQPSADREDEEEERRRKKERREQKERKRQELEQQRERERQAEVYTQVKPPASSRRAAASAASEAEGSRRAEAERQPKPAPEAPEAGSRPETERRSGPSAAPSARQAEKPKQTVEEEAGFAPGFQLPGYLSFVKRLGSGAYGEVVLCDDKETEQQVAVKLIRDFAKDPLRGKRILREVRLLAYLHHTNLLNLTDILAPPSPDFDDIYIVMPYLQVDLHRLIHSKVPLVEAQSKAFVCQILRGLKYMHSAGVMHRDLKPSNLLVNKDCSLKIADFGLARGTDVEDAAMTEYVVTRWYRAPELLLLPSGYTEAVDLWSVGCIHVELLSREPLFPGKDHFDQLRRIAESLGFSVERDLAWVPAQNLKEVKRMLGTKRLPENPEKPLTQRIKNVEAEQKANCLDLVTKLLDKVPGTRLSAADAISHPYLAHLQNPEAEAVAEEKFDWTFDQFEATRRSLKDRVYAECARYHPEIVERDAEWIRRRGFGA